MRRQKLRDELIEAGDRLRQAMRLERYFGGLYAESHDETVLAQWNDSRLLSQRATEEYTAVFERCMASRSGKIRKAGG